ncbi:MAG: transposase [Candidatus Obscuribacterales bacterium]|nr:transposase [Candidatus Obscuribacterales bacterium]
MKKTPGKNPAAREKYWTKIIIEARKYPKGVTEYCRVMNISKNNYYFWFKRLRPKHPEWFDLSNHPEPLVREKKEKIPGVAEASLPPTEVPARAQRRKWSAADRERILNETDRLSASDLAAALRREGLYVHTLNKWRTERDLRQIATRKTNAPSPLLNENKKLKEENAKLQKKLQQANEIIQLQKKISQMLTMTIDSTDDR